MIPPGVTLVDLTFDPLQEGVGFLDIPGPPAGDFPGVQGNPFAGRQFEEQHLVFLVVIPAAQFGVEVWEGRGDVVCQGGDAVPSFLGGIHFGPEDVVVENLG